MKSQRFVLVVSGMLAAALCVGALGCASNQEESSKQGDQQQSEQPSAPESATSEPESAKPAETKTPTSTEASASDEESQIEALIAKAKADDPYVADEVCLSCHGGTYEAVAQLTWDYGDSNPHGGTHGMGGMSCGQCHEKGNQKPTEDQNMCFDCHAWPREDESYLEFMDL